MLQRRPRSIFISLISGMNSRHLRVQLLDTLICIWREKSEPGGRVSIELELIEVNVTSSQCIYQVSRNPTTETALGVNTETLVVGVRLETVYEASCINFQQEKDCSSEGPGCF